MGRKKKNKPVAVVCILCDKKIRVNQQRTIIAVEKPIYLNITVHFKCRRKIDENTQEKAVIRHIQELL